MAALEANESLLQRPSFARSILHSGDPDVRIQSICVQLQELLVSRGVIGYTYPEHAQSGLYSACVDAFFHAETSSLGREP